MPGFDGTGPRGGGPLTGGGRGYCVTSADGRPSYGRGRNFGGRGWGRGLGRGFGRGRGWGQWYGPGVYSAVPTTEEEIDMLQEEAIALRAELKAVQTQIDTLSREKGQENK